MRASPTHSRGNRAVAVCGHCFLATSLQKYAPDFRFNQLHYHLYQNQHSDSHICIQCTPICQVTFVSQRTIHALFSLFLRYELPCLPEATSDNKIKPRWTTKRFHCAYIPLPKYLYIPSYMYYIFSRITGISRKTDVHNRIKKGILVKGILHIVIHADAMFQQPE